MATNPVWQTGLVHRKEQIIGEIKAETFGYRWQDGARAGSIACSIF